MMKTTLIEHWSLVVSSTSPHHYTQLVQWCLLHIVAGCPLVHTRHPKAAPVGDEQGDVFSVLNAQLGVQIAPKSDPHTAVSASLSCPTRCAGTLAAAVHTCDVSHAVPALPPCVQSRAVSPSDPTWCVSSQRTPCNNGTRVRLTRFRQADHGTICVKFTRGSTPCGV